MSSRIVPALKMSLMDDVGSLDLKARLAYRYRAFRYRYRIDKKEIAFILQSLNPGEVAVDIGAHKGGYMYWMLDRVGSTGHCYAFEPQPRLHAYLSAIKKHYHHENLTVEPLALSAESGSAQLFVPESSSGQSPGASLQSHIAPNAIPAKTTSLDEYFFNRRIQPRLLKIDVEGHEAAVIRGGKQLLASCKPKIVMECEQRHLREGTVQEVFDLLLQLNYSGFFWDGEKRLPLLNFFPDQYQKQGDGRFWEAPGYVNNFFFE
jgi:FkbM family methyltransferase